MDFLDEQRRLVAAPEPRWIASPKRVRAFLAGVALVDTTRANLFRGGGPPFYYFAKDDVRTDIVVANGRTEADARGTRALYDVTVDGRVAEDGAWEYTEPVEGVAFLKGMVSLRWGAMDSWFEENEEVFVHARDPFKRIDTVHSSRRVEVRAGGEKVADSVAPVILIEPGHPLRYYLPKSDIRMDLLRPSENVSQCPYKGKAGYYSLEVGGEALENAAWSYQYTTPESTKVAGLVCFFNERVDAIVVDGQEIEKPATAWRR